MRLRTEYDIIEMFGSHVFDRDPRIIFAEIALSVAREITV